MSLTIYRVSFSVTNLLVICGHIFAFICDLFLQALVKEARENMIFRDPDDVVVTLEKAAQVCPTNVPHVVGPGNFFHTC